MPKNEAPITDLINGVYRRQYAGYLVGKRINALTLEAEAWFWRVHAAVDDFGNMRAEPLIVWQQTAGRRAVVTVEDVDRWLFEISAVDLIRFYESGSERYLHVVDFILRQPAGRNGKRVRRVPPSPWDHAELDGESTRGIRMDAGESSAPIPTPIPTPIPKRDACASCPQPPSATAGPHVEDLTKVPFPLFPISGKRGKSNTWRLTDSLIAELSETYPAVNVPSECRKAWQWVKSNLNRRKTASGMTRYLNSWMSREQNKSHSSNGNFSKVDAQRERVRRLVEKSNEPS